MGGVFDTVVKLPVVTDVVTTKLERILLGWGTPSPFTTNIFSLPPPLKPYFLACPPPPTQIPPAPHYLIKNEQSLMPLNKACIGHTKKHGGREVCNILPGV